MTKADTRLDDLSKLSESELEDLAQALRTERLGRALTPIREALTKLGVRNVDAVMDAICETMEM